MAAAAPLAARMQIKAVVDVLRLKKRTDDLRALTAFDAEEDFWYLIFGLKFIDIFLVLVASTDC